MTEKWYGVINAGRAVQLRRLGYSWKEIGQILADDEGRGSSFQVHSVKAAVRRKYGVLPNNNSRKENG